MGNKKYTAFVTFLDIRIKIQMMCQILTVERSDAIFKKYKPLSEVCI